MFQRIAFKRLNRAYLRSRVLEFDPQRNRYIIFSDQHLGDGKKGSDDFYRHRKLYHHALSEYYDKDFTLISVGDVEELWECNFRDIMKCYPDIYEMESRFLKKGRFIRIYGNHDRRWERRKKIKNELNQVLPGAEVDQGVIIQWEKPDQRIFIAHGHQGGILDDIFWRVSKLIVRYFWKNLQRLARIPSTSPAKNHKIRDSREQIYYKWAKKKKLLFIAGHTHRAMFESYSKIDRLKIKIDKLNQRIKEIEEKIEKEGSLEDLLKKRDQLAEDLLDLKKRLQVSLDENRQGKEQKDLEPGEVPVPCYFNDGCCCFPHCITGIEIEDGMIRLVKWQDSGGFKKEPFEEAEIKLIFDSISRHAT